MACPTELGSFYVPVEVVWGGAWLRFEAWSLYIAEARGDVSLPKLYGHAANGDKKFQGEGAKAQHQRRSLPMLVDEHRRKLGKRTSARANCGVLAATRACLLRRLRRQRVLGSNQG